MSIYTKTRTHQIYRHIRLDTNEVFYVGISAEDRKRAHDTKARNIFWKRVYESCGRNIEVEIMMDELSWEQACQKEIEFIALYGRRDLKKGTLCNLTDGGDGSVGHKQSAEQIAKRVAKQTGKPLSEEHKDKLRAVRVGENNPMYGKANPRSQDMIDRTADSNRGKRRTAEQIQHIKEGRWKDHELIVRRRKSPEEIKQALLNRPKFDEETKKKMRESHLVVKKVIDVQTGVIYNCIRDAADSIGVKYNNLIRKLNGTRKNNTSFKFLTDKV